MPAKPYPEVPHLQVLRFQESSRVSEASGLWQVGLGHAATCSLPCLNGTGEEMPKTRVRKSMGWNNKRDTIYQLMLWEKQA